MTEKDNTVRCALCGEQIHIEEFARHVKECIANGTEEKVARAEARNRLREAAEKLNGVDNKALTSSERAIWDLACLMLSRILVEWEWQTVIKQEGKG